MKNKNILKSKSELNLSEKHNMNVEDSIVVLTDELLMMISGGAAYEEPANPVRDKNNN
jgi:hypothetical protein